MVFQITASSCVSFNGVCGTQRMRNERECMCEVYRRCENLNHIYVEWNQRLWIEDQILSTETVSGFLFFISKIIIIIY